MPEVIRVRLGLVSAFLVRGDRVILVDTGIPASMPRIQRAMNAHAIKPSDLSLILLTHGHGDHAGGANAARALTGAKVAMHKACAEGLRHGHLPVSPPRTTMAWVLQTVFGRLMKIEPVEPDIEIGDEFDLRPFGVDGKAVHTPGHTSGCGPDGRHQRDGRPVGCRPLVLRAILGFEKQTGDRHQSPNPERPRSGRRPAPVAH